MARPPILEGVVRALTLAPGIVPLGMVFGATAVRAGLSPAAATALSAVVFAGAAQLSAVGLLATGASIASAVAIVAIVNARYVLLSAAALDLARKGGATRAQRVAGALGVVDESYALQAAWASAAKGSPERSERGSVAADKPRAQMAKERAAAKQAVAPAVGLLAVSATLWTLWVGATLTGALLGEALPDIRPLGLDYALPGIAIGLLGIFADTKERLVAGLAALAIAGALALLGFGTVAILVVPPVLAFGLGTWGPRR